MFDIIHQHHNDPATSAKLEELVRLLKGLQKAMSESFQAISDELAQVKALNAKTLENVKAILANVKPGMSDEEVTQLKSQADDLLAGAQSLETATEPAPAPITDPTTETPAA